LMCYEPVGINDWYIFSAAPEEFINPQSLEIMYRATTFMLFIALLAVTVFIYITITQKKHVRELRQIAFVDSLTGYFNKKQFKLTASELLSKSERDYAFVILDIDKFKVLNDTLGYPCGDELLRDIAAVLKERMQEGEIFGRCDSDEFYILLFYVDDAALRSRINAIMAQIEMKFNSRRTYSYRLILCAGVYVIAKPNEAINVISDRARHAHRLIKGKDESGIAFYNDEIRNNILQEKVIENRMHGALENKEFVIFLQPKYYLNSSKIYGAEALCRWQNSDGTMMYPNDFIPIFEKNGFVTKLDMYMLSMACKTIKGWIDAGITPIPISINFSRLHLKNQFFVDDIAAIVQEYNVPTHLIEIELTESTMLDNEDVLINMLTHLHEHGFTLSMDDFGSGYSSLGLLKNLPVDVIKLDRSFVGRPGDEITLP
ncbi:MAG: EAL domain-containing protein, partial [Angelakisella sp.]